MDSYNRFFLVILKEMLKDDKIRLPTKTERKFGAKIPNRVIFKLPDGLEWEIEVIKSIEMVWFHIGWREFTEYYGLDFGSLLTLKFDGESAFKVCIFDKTANEIDYTEFKEKDSIKVEGDLLIEMRGKSSLPDPRPFKKVKPEDPWTGTAEFRDTHIVSDDREEGDEPETEAHTRGVAPREDNSDCHGSAPERAFEFTPKNPFFVTPVYQSHITGSCCLYLPSSFRKTHLKGVNMEHLQGIVLQTSDGKKWSAKLHLNKKNQDFQVRIGWYKFIHDNNLEKGDFCVFELILDLQIIFIVHIFRASESERENSHHCRGGDRKIDVNDPSSFSGGPKSWQITRHVTQNPFFEICICTSSILLASLHIPAKFANKYLVTEDIDKVTLKVGDRRWVVRVKKYCNAIKLSGGWRTFARDNALRVRDVCIFELVGDTYEFQVSILRPS